MSRKCSFKVVYSSSEEVGYSASELNHHTPSSVGWQSIKFCEYPQEVGLMLTEDEDNNSEEMKELDLEPRKALRYLTQVQLLVHEFKIASRVEMYVGVGSDYQEADFERLGFMNLDGNERSNYQARELKTVYVDEREANYIRLIIHRPHHNNRNLFQQVGFLAVNVVGEAKRVETRKSQRALEDAQGKLLDDKLNEYKGDSKGKGGGMYSGHSMHNGGKFAADKGVDEFAYNNAHSLTMAMDAQSQDKLTLLQRAKQDAIDIEDFDRAKCIKALEHDLKLTGVKVRKLDTLKAEAVRAEDYDYAKQVKAEAAALRKAMDEKIMALRIPGFDAIVMANNNNNNNGGVSGQSSRIEHGGDDDSSWGPAPGKNIASSPQQEAPFSARHVTQSHQAATAPHQEMAAAAVNRQPAWGPADRRLIEMEEEEEQFGPAMVHHHDDDSRASRDDNHSQQQVEELVEPDSPRERQFQSMTSYPSMQAGVVDPNAYPTTIDEVDEAANFDGTHPLEGVPGFHELPAPEELQEEQFSAAQQSGLLNLLGEFRARCACSKVFALRDACLVKLRLMLQTASRELPPLFECIPPLAALLNQTLDDKIHQVIARSVSLLEDLLRLAASSRLATAATASHLDPLLAKLIHKLEDGNARTRDVALRGVDAFITSPYFGPRVVTSHALRPLDKHQLKGHAWRPLVARMRLLRDIVANFGINNEETGATTETVMRFPKEHCCFSHSNGDVRDAAKELTTAVESVVGVHALELFMRELRPRQLEEYHASFEAAAKDDKFKGLGSRKINKPSVLTPRTHTKKAGVASGGQVQTSAVRSLEREGVTDQGGEEYCQCMFCGASDPGWNEDALDLHYWKDCTFLTPCPACAQVVEIAGLADHLLDECEHRGLYINCEVTGLAVREDDYADFQRSEQYRAAPEEHFYCPLCYQACPDNDAAWKRHISMQCAQNTRI